MAEIFVACPECGLRVRVTSQGDELRDAKSKCNHRQNPFICPMLQPALAKGRRAVHPSES